MWSLSAISSLHTVINNGVPIWIIHILFLCAVLISAFIVRRYCIGHSLRFIAAAYLMLPFGSYVLRNLIIGVQGIDEMIVALSIFSLYCIATVTVLKIRFPILNSDAFYRAYAVITAVTITVLIIVIRLHGYDIESVSLWQWCLAMMPIALLVVENKKFLSTVNTIGSTTGKRDSTTEYRVLWIIAILATILLGSVGRIATLDAFSFQNDEYFHVNTAKGFNETGDYVRWDWQTDESLAEYTRASSYTWQVAQSIAFFGEDTEWKFRFPSVLWGIILLLLTPIIILHITKRIEIAWIVTAIIAFDNGYIWASQYTRMYSFFAVIALCIIWLFWLSVRETVPKKCITFARQLLYRISLLLLACLLSFIARDVHYTSLLFLPAFTVILVVLLYSKRSTALVKYYKYMLGILFAAIFLALIRHVFVPYLPFDFVTLRLSPLYEYITFPIKEILMYAIAALLFFVTAVRFTAYKNYPVWLIVFITLSVSILMYFVFFGDRYDARKYAMFVYIPTITVIAAAWFALFNVVIDTIVQQRKRMMFSLSFLCCSAFIFLPVSIPGMEQSLLFRQARADKTHTELEYHNYEEGYRIIEETVEDNATIAVFTPRTYYMERNDIEWIRMETGKVVTIEDIQTLQKIHDSGWIVWPKYKREHVKKSVRQYIASEMERYDTGESNIVLYRWE